MLLLMAGGIRYLVCCDDCGVDAMPNDQAGSEYTTEQIALSIRQWAITTAGWLLRDPSTEEEWLSCPECSAVATNARKMSAPTLRLVPNVD